MKMLDETEKLKEYCNKSQHLWYRSSAHDLRSKERGDIIKFGLKCTRCLDVILTSQPLFVHKTY